MRLCKAYGTRVHALVNGAQSVESLGAHFGHGLYEIEVRYLVDREWARSADDILFRRSKLGLHLATAAQARLQKWLDENTQLSVADIF